MRTLTAQPVNSQTKNSEHFITTHFDHSTPGPQFLNTSHAGGAKVRSHLSPSLHPQREAGQTMYYPFFLPQQPCNLQPTIAFVFSTSTSRTSSPTGSRPNHVFLSLLKPNPRSPFGTTFNPLHLSVSPSTSNCLLVQPIPLTPKLPTLIPEPHSENPTHCPLFSRPSEICFNHLAPLPHKNMAIFNTRTRSRPQDALGS
jgi:hypothetical protein